MIRFIVLFMAVPQERQRYVTSIRLKENIIRERMPQIASFNLFICGSIVGRPTICNGYKHE